MHHENRNILPTVFNDSSRVKYNLLSTEEISLKENDIDNHNILLSRRTDRSVNILAASSVMSNRVLLTLERKELIW